ISGKMLELTREIVPELTRVALIAPPTMLKLFSAETTAAARVLGLEIVEIALALPEVDAALRQAIAEGAQAAIVRGRPFFWTTLAKLTAERAIAYRLPVIYESRDFVE